MKATRKILDREDEDRLQSIAIVGLAYQLRGRQKVGEKLEVQVLKTRTKKLGTNYLDTLGSINNLALTYRN